MFGAGRVSSLRSSPLLLSSLPLAMAKPQLLGACIYAMEAVKGALAALDQLMRGQQTRQAHCSKLVASVPFTTLANAGGRYKLVLVLVCSSRRLYLFMMHRNLLCYVRLPLLWGYL